jgi:tocopherol O-methyltransferase
VAAEARMSEATPPRFDAAQVSRYYDRHTPGFLALGQGGSAGAIHRAVWGPGVRHRSQAFHYVDDRIAELIAALPLDSTKAHVVDLGCGVGGSLGYLAARLPIRATGITLSPVQAALARQRLAEAGVSDRVACLEGDYNDLPHGLEPADLAFAIESFVHGPAPGRFFEQCRRLIRPGGVLVICDDVRRPTTEPAAARAVDRFCRGWHVNSLLQREALQALAREAGFEHQATVDLSAYLELGRVRDRLLGMLVSVLERLPVDPRRFDHVSGGSALQVCLARGWIGYELATFRRSPDGVRLPV